MIRTSICWVVASCKARQELLPDAFEKVGQCLPGQDAAEAYKLDSTDPGHSHDEWCKCVCQAASHSMLDAWRSVAQKTRYCF